MILLALLANAGISHLNLLVVFEELVFEYLVTRRHTVVYAGIHWYRGLQLFLDMFKKCLRMVSRLYFQYIHVSVDGTFLKMYFL